ncbi:peptide transporter [Thermococcus profundus]|uniref:Peptide transporter n=1 Tax=Thermococcus profundus TaxID=49899 RepID=A0A2Z2MMI6_THEPR|nr:ABC transporter permease [Thermococcus profundus]ASJ03641.1 peptide transporter [Thermococcus profundus]
MRWVDFKESLSEFANEFKREKTGMLGLILLILLVVVAAAAPIITEPNFPDKWRDPQYWEAYPQTVPPTWYNMFTSKDLVPQQVYTVDSPNVHVDNQKRSMTIEVQYNLSDDYYYGPKGILIKGFNVTVPPGSPFQPKISVYLERPDGRTVPLVEKKPLSSGMSIAIGRDGNIKKATYIWLYKEVTGKTISPDDVPVEVVLIRDMVRPLFAVVDPSAYSSKNATGLVDEIISNPQTLHGTYTLKVTITKPFRTDVKVDNLHVTFLGRVYGSMGTDYQGRDLWAAIIWGSRVSLVIGITVSLLSTIIGIVYGVTSAYLGGNADEVLMRINELFSSIPSLPILILIGATMGHIPLSMIVLLLVVFGWMGIARISRSMALQIKEQTYVEAARALGAGTGRIIFKHMLPQLLPYAFAVIALNVPIAVISEASLSFLGLGDPTSVTWGQILHDAEVQSAATKGYWWWVLPPGLGIAVVGLTFVLIGTALDRILNPRLRRL